MSPPSEAPHFLLLPWLAQRQGLRGHKPFATLDWVVSTFIVVLYNRTVTL